MKTFWMKLLAVPVAILAVAAMAPPSVNAHSGVQSYLYIDITEQELGGRVEMPFGDLRTVFGYELDGTEDEILAELTANLEEMQDYVQEHLEIGTDGTRWTYEMTTLDVLYAETGYVLLYYLVDVPADTVPRQLEILFDPFFDDIDDRDALLLISNDWQSGVIDNGEEVLLGFDVDNRVRSVDLGEGSQWNNFTASIDLGVDHIRSGPDHVLFVLVLLLPSVLLFTVAWKPVPTFAGSLWRILKIVSMFTLAHSITFGLAGLEVLPLPPSRLVETIIAASIGITALHNLHPIVHNREWAIAFVFGLFHGMGFASLVSGLDVSDGTKLVSLLGRNVGIEIGQAVVVLLVFPALFLLRRTKWYRPIFVAASIALAVTAFGWMIERLFDQDLKVSRIVDPLVKFPRSLLFVAVLTAAAAAVHVIERRAGRLIPLDGPADTSGDEDRELELSGSGTA